MAVKQHDSAHDDSQVDLSRLTEYIQAFHQHGYLPTLPELTKWCKDLVKRLSRAQIPRDSDRLAVFLDQLRIAEDFLQTIVDNVAAETRDQIIFGVLKRLYSVIIDPHREPCPAASIVLSLAQGDAIKTSVECMIKEASATEGSGSQGMRLLLSTLYHWLATWQCTPILGEWILALVKALEKKDHLADLVDISFENIDPLLEALLSPTPIRYAVAPVVLHLLASLRQNHEVLRQIASRIPLILENLASDSNMQSRQVLQNLVDIASYMVSYQSRRDDFLQLRACLDTHITANIWLDYLTIPPWDISDLNDKHLQFMVPLKKIGLINLGNTCYMNSVLQALLLTKNFSYEIIRRKHCLPYWRELGQLFVMLTYSMRLRLDPSVFFTLVRPPHFTRHQQHDTSEFLVYLLELLNQQERYALSLDKHLNATESSAIVLRRGSSKRTATVVSDATNSGSSSYVDHDQDAPMPLVKKEDKDSDSEDVGLPPCKKEKRDTSPIERTVERLHDNEGTMDLTISGKTLNNKMEIQQEQRNRDFFASLNLASTSSSFGEIPIKRARNIPNSQLPFRKRSLPNDDVFKKRASPIPNDLNRTSPVSVEKKEAHVQLDDDVSEPLPENPDPTQQHGMSGDTFVQSIFGGVQMTRLKCLDCNTESTRRDVFRDLHLAIPEKVGSALLTVQNLVDFYCTTERLCDDNRYRCPTCGDLREAERTVTIEHPPRYLILVLKNFRYNPKTGERAKLLHTVHQSKFLTVPNSTKKRANYYLYAMIVHTGTTIDSGHYFAYGRDRGHWFRFNDDTVEMCSDIELNALAKSSTPYMLFYRRQDIVEDTEPPSLDSVPQNLADLINSDNKEYLEQLQNHRGPTTRNNSARMSSPPK